MQYVKKMCILRQLKQGFSCDGQPISGIVKAEQYGKNIAVDVSVLNLASLSSGQWYCLFADAAGRKQLLPLQETRHFSFVDEMDIARGFLAVLCFVGDDAQPIAVGTSGKVPFTAAEIAKRTFTEKRPTPPASTPPLPQKTESAPADAGHYNDEAMMEENYYQWSNEDEQQRMDEACRHAQSEGRTENEETAQGTQIANNEDGAGVRHAFTAQTDRYYQSIKSELNDLFARFPRDDSLCGAFAASEWIRVKGDAHAPQELVGIVFENGMAKYICYALPADGRELPSELQRHCFYVPTSPLQGANGFFVVFQSAATGETIPQTDGVTAK